MLKLRSNRGFTLIELLVVVIIVAVLAAVGVPLLSANVERARASEAEAGLGSIRTAMRTFFSEHGTYTGAVLTGIGLNINLAQGLGDLDGRFFGDGAYTLAVTGGGAGFCASVDGNAGGNEAARKNLVDGTGGTLVQRAMDNNGTLRSSTNCTTGTILN